MRKLLTALSVVLLAASVFAQGSSITGTVTDESGGTLPGATVVVTGPGGTKTAVTGGDGKFSVDGLAAGTYKVMVSMPSFAAVTQDVAAGGNANFSLKIANLGETLVVSASKVETTVANAPATMSVISSATIESAPSQSFGDVLRNVPGVNVIQMSARDVNLTSRSNTTTLATSQLVLLDGRSIYLDFFGLVLWDLVPSNPNDIRQIEVVRGPASAVWGANALTGVVNIITKSPRENPGTTLTLTGGSFGRKGGSMESQGSGSSFGANVSFNRALNDKWAMRLAAGYFDSDPYSRPVGTIPVTTHPLDSRIRLGGAPYPADTSTGTPGTVFQNQGTKQPKVDLRLDQDLSNGGRMGYSLGYAGTEGIVHTGIGPFDLQNGSYMAYGRAGYAKNAFKAAAFVNTLDAEAPNLLLTDPDTRRPVALNFKTQTLDFEAGNSNLVNGKHVISYGGNVRRNNFDITLAPASKDRNEFGAYLQEEYFTDNFRLAVGGRVDKFGNIDKAVFSPRVTVMLKPSKDQTFRIGFNKAFRSPSAVNNFLKQDIFAPTLVDLRALSALAALAPADVRPALTTPFSLRVTNVGNPKLKEESLTAYEVSYTGTFNDRTTIGIAAYRNETNDNINFASILPSASNPAGISPFDVYTTANAPALIGITTTGVPVPGSLIGFLAQIAPLIRPIVIPPFPRTVSTYLNLAGTQQDGIELSLDHRFNNVVSMNVNYSYQKTPKILAPASGQQAYPTEELALPAKSRFNAGLNWNSEKWVGSAQVNYQDKALWLDVLTAPFQGYTDSFTMVNANIGYKWNKGKVVTAIKGMNLLDKKIQQHVFGDILRRSVTAEARFTF